MSWIELKDAAQLEELIAQSKHTPQVIFKHSTRCSISTMVKARLEKGEKPANTTFYYLDLIRYRDISNAIAEQFHVFHESPQVLLIKDGECIYDESHNGIRMEFIAEQVN